jgi:chromosome segregation protein
LKLNRLELFGFKSFADRTGFDFDRGMTVLVGPNGCGKSNVVDSLKWVLGEQRPSSLRGKEMMDVLFNGTSARKRLGLAEVSVTFDNEDGVLPVDYGEVVVTRRLYRDGGSEFLINQNPCRLRDIRELFMDTGTGVESYSIMEQGRIDALLKAGPKDRRAIFDEASGIAKFKARRREAERKLEKVEANLERLQDVLDLTLKRERSVKIQAGRARRFQEMTEALRALRLRIALHRYRLLLEDRRVALSRIESLASAERLLGEKIEGLTAELRAAEGDLEKQASDLHEVEGRQAGNESSLVATRERIEAMGRLRGELEERMQRDEALVQRSDGVLASLRTRLESCVNEVREATQAVEEGQGQLVEAETVCEEARRRRTGLLKERESMRRESLRLLGEITSRENRRSRLEADAEGLDARLSRLTARLEETAREAERLGKSADDAASAAAALDTRLEDESEGQRRREEGLGTAESELEDLRSAIEALDRETAAARSRRDVLVKLQSAREGVSSGAKAVLEHAETALAGVKGCVADYLEVEVEHAHAVEALLGDRAEAIVTETFEDALRAIDFLREGNRGRATFLPLDIVDEDGGGGGEGWLDRDSLPIWARASADLVRSRNGCGGKLMTALLGDAVVVEGMAGARELRQTGGRNRIVTGGGDLLEPTGLVTGGDGEEGAGLVSRNAEIRELGGILQNLAGRREACIADRDRKVSVLSDLRRELEDARARLGSLREARAQRLSEADRYRSEGARLEEANALDLREREECEAARQTRREELAAIEAELEERREAEAELRRRGEELDEQARRFARELAEAEERRTERRIGIARAHERKSAAEARFAAAEREIAEAERSREAASSDLERCRERRGDCEREEEEARRSLAELETLREHIAKDAESLRRRAEESRRDLKVRRDRNDDLRREMDGYQRELQEFRLKENESRLRLEALIERTAEECGQDLATALDEDFEEPQDTDWDALEAEAAETRRKLERLGNVNLDAIEELEELEEKSRFLQEQKDDLVTARETLLRTIREINDRSRTLFLETFTAVREGFRSTFRKLFGGGRADVLLEDPDDPLECGIEIVARPPGKELRTIGLLSGGERTMAACALMFAFFEAKPTPFVILDEVDAALDEANIDRFLGLVREHAERSQFVIITHSRRTMSVADALYGITMVESGVSRRVALKLGDDASRDGEDVVKTLGRNPRVGV